MLFIQALGIWTLTGTLDHLTMKKMRIIIDIYLYYTTPRALHFNSGP